jgi:hypothetical protein
VVLGVLEEPIVHVHDGLVFSLPAEAPPNVHANQVAHATVCQVSQVKGA